MPTWCWCWHLPEKPRNPWMDGWMDGGVTNPENANESAVSESHVASLSPFARLHSRVRSVLGPRAFLCRASAQDWQKDIRHLKAAATTSEVKDSRPKGVRPGLL